MEDDAVKKCTTCKKTKLLCFFPNGLKSCDKCVAYRLAYQQRKREEREAIPRRKCEICKWDVQLEHWENHYNLPSHIIARLEDEYKDRKKETRKQTEKEKLEQEINEKIVEVRNTEKPWYEIEKEQKQQERTNQYRLLETQYGLPVGYLCCDKKST